MKALQYFGPKQLKLVDVPVPDIKENEILMKIKKVGICGTDLHIYNGGMDVPTPLIMGHEFVGDIVRVGSDVLELKEGDRVVAEHVIGCNRCEYCKIDRKNICINPTVIGLQRPGALAEYLSVPADLVYKLPDNLNYDQGVLVEPLSIAVYAVRKSEIKVGDSALVIGQGPIGLFLDQVLKDAGVKVFGTDVVDSRLNFAKNNGYADEILNSKDPDFNNKLMQLTDNLGPDYVFEAVGREETAEMAFNSVRGEGKIVFLGVFESKVNLSLMRIVKKEITIVGSWTCINSFKPTIELLSNSIIKTDQLITHRYKFEDAIKAFEDASVYSDNRIKTVIEFD